MRLLTALSTLSLLVPTAVGLAACSGEIGGQQILPGAGGAGHGGSGPVACTEEGEAQFCWPGEPATRQIGICEDGSQTCVQGAWDACEGYTLPDEEERCNDGLDNNCNGVEDEGCACEPGTSRPCYSGPASTRGLGICQDGQQECTSGVWATECVGEIVPVTEACDTVDNDCDGAADEGCSCVDGTTRPCYTGPNGTEDVGECHGGQQTCQDGEWSSSCAGQNTPDPESCNNDDDDCDGSTDEGDPGGGGSCDSGEPGVCSDGTRHCQNGSLICDPDQNPSSESCNNQDDDCDGSTDEGDPGGGGGCSTGMPGICAAGTLHCVSGSIQCQQNQTAHSESCNNLDDDCDGATDEGSLCSVNYQCIGGTCQQICPYVYAHDGAGYVYETSVGGAGIPRQVRHGRFGRERRIPWRFRPLWAPLDHGRIRWQPMSAAQGRARGAVRAKLVAAEDEIVYLRRARLAVVEHPPEHEIYSSTTADWHGIGQPDRGQLLALGTASLRPPLHASWRDRVDVTEALSSRNDEPAAFDEQTPNTYELDFGRVRNPKAARLVIDGWKFKIHRKLPTAYRYRYPSLQVEQADGSWRTVIDRVPTPRGDRKPVVVDLKDIPWPTGRYRMRLHTGTHQRGQAMWYLDRVRLTEQPAAPVRVRQLEAAAATLSYAGPPTLLCSDEPSRPRLSMDDGGGEPTVAHQTKGALTGYGDVRPLVRQADDQLVVMERGDAVELDFQGLPAPRAGAAQSLFLDLELLYKPRLDVRDRTDAPGDQWVLPIPYEARDDPADFDELAHERFMQATLTRAPGEAAARHAGRQRKGA